MDTNQDTPEQQQGSQSDTTHTTKFDSVKAAADFFETAKKRLLDVSDWDKLCGSASSTFHLTDSNGNKVNRPAQKGDYFKINIPAPGTDTGDGFDWVRIENIEENKDQNRDTKFVAIKVRPAKNPENNDQETAHFFKDAATSTFIVKQEGTSVSAEVHGRNEVPNTENTGIMDTLRNTVVALGAMLGFSKPQWKSLVKGLVDTGK